MKHTLRILALTLALMPSLAFAQSAPANMPYRTVYGRLGAAPGDTGPGQAIPFATLSGQLLNGLCTTNNAIPIFSSALGRWTCTAALGTGVTTALAVNVGSAGSFVVNGGALGTPSSGTATNLTGLPIGTGVSGLGTGVATALGVNVGTAGAPVINGGALGTPSSGVATNLTGTASGLTAGTVTTNANLTGPVTSTGNATAIANNQITRAMNAQGIARSVIGVTGNGTANVADIQGTADQVLIVNSAGTALTFGQINLGASAAVSNALAVANGGTGDTGTAWTAFTATPTCGTATITNTSSRRKTAGKITYIEIDFTITALGSCLTTLSFTLPNTAQSGGGLVGREFGVTGKGYTCDVRPASATATCSLADISNHAVNAHILASGVYENQ